jgi:hypothetical protein
VKALDTMLAITAEKWVKISGMREDGNGSLIRKMCVKDVSPFEKSDQMFRITIIDHCLLTSVSVFL